MDSIPEAQHHYWCIGITLCELIMFGKGIKIFEIGCFECYFGAQLLGMVSLLVH
jgi:hypothetical protein